MADYYQLKNQNIFNPPANTSLGNTSNQFGNAFVQNDLVLGNVTVTGATINTPKVNTIGYPGDDTAADTAGGQTITLTGSGFLAGASVLINGSAVGVVTVVSTTTITFTSPANSTGSYVLYVINTDGGTAILIPGIQYSGVPTWTTAAGSLGNVYETASFNQSVTATGDAPITYSLFSGSIPPGATFNSNGTITGTSQLLSSSTTYTFTVRATDAEAQDTNRSFSLTINPDVVTWSSPANGTTYTSTANSAISNVTLVATSAVGSGITYTANALPTGLSLTGANISGTPTVEANSSSLLTATANTTSESSAITINWVIGVANDIFFEYNTLLIPGASTTFVDDASTNNFAVSIFGDTKPNNFNPYTPGYYSNYFDGTGDYLATPGTGNFTISGDFTFSCWVYPTSFATLSCLTTNFNGSITADKFAFEISTSGAVIIYINGVSSPRITSSSNIQLNTWSFIALVRSGTTTTLYINGVSTGTYVVASYTVGNATAPVLIGMYASNEYFTGYISNYRWVNGSAITTVPTSPLTAVSGTQLLTCQSNRFIDNSTNNFTITVFGNTLISSFDPFVPNTSYSTYGSGYFDGTGDYLTVPNNTSLGMGSGNFTVEFWVYQTSLVSYRQILDVVDGNSVGRLILWVDSAGTLYNLGQNGNARNTTAAGAITINTWIHVALVRSSGTTKFYINGTQSGSNYTDSTNYTCTTGSVYIGINSDGGTYPYQGYLTDFRMVKGTAVYTTAFTPPSTPLTAISGTSLLTLQNNQSVNNSVFLDNSTNNFLVTRNGNTTQGTFSPYGGNWSNYVDTAYQGISNTTSLIGATVTTFTAECWIYMTAAPASGDGVPCLIGMDAQPASSIYLGFGPNASRQLVLRWFDGVSKTATGGTALALNTWYHIAVVSNSNSLAMYVNGVAETLSGTTTLTNRNGTGSSFALMSNSSVSAYQFKGYASNIRVTTTAVYTSAFTPSTTPLTPITGTKLLTSQSNRIVDSSINNYTLTLAGSVTIQRFSPFNPSSVTPTSYSGYFDGTGDSLRITGNTNLNPGTGDFTVEAWCNPSNTSGGYQAVYIIGPNTDDGLFYNGTNIIWYQAGAKITGTGLGTANTWQHLAVSRSSGTTRLFVNGSLSGSYSDSYNYNSSTPAIGANFAVTEAFIGYISNVRFVKGTAVYTASFTPPTSPLTAISGTSLLTCQSPTFIDNSTNNFAITANGNSQPTQQNPFGVTSALTNGYTANTIGGSGYFDGTGDQLSYANNPIFAFFTSNFTVECWIYPLSSSTQSVMNYSNGQAAASNFAWEMYQNSGTQIQFSILDSDGGTQYTAQSAGLRINSWNHIAAVRNGNTMSIYVNGVVGGTTVSVTGVSVFNKSGATLKVSGYNNASTMYTGYVSDFRVVNGTGLYTSNFVPPSAPLTAVQNTALLTNMTSAGIIDNTMINNLETVGNAQISTAQTKFGGGSMSFDGVGDYLITPNTQLLNLSSGNFTIEAWVYYTVVNVSGTIIDKDGVFNSTLSSYSFGLKNSKLNMFLGSGNGISYAQDITAPSNLPTNQWVHVAVVKSGSTITLYQNGTSVASAAQTGTIVDGGKPILVGWQQSQPQAQFWSGYIDDLRVTKGYARYTSNFTPPTTAFPIF